MSKDRERSISRRSDASWENKHKDASRASSVHRTQREAEQAAKELLRNQGGSELTTKGCDGKIRSKNAIAPGNYPDSPKGKEYRSKHTHDPEHQYTFC